MPFRQIPAESLHEVPERLRDLATYLNKVNNIDPKAVLALVSWAAPAQAKELEAAFPHMVIHDWSDQLLLSGLGLLGGFVNTERYRLSADFDDEDGRLVRFSIVEFYL